VRSRFRAIGVKCDRDSGRSGLSAIGFHFPKSSCIYPTVRRGINSPSHSESRLKTDWGILMQFLRIHIECELRSELAYTILELESELEYPSETMEIQQQKQARESNKQLSNRHFARITTITQGKT
jgi:hypothetical protein